MLVRFAIISQNNLISHRQIISKHPIIGRFPITPKVSKICNYPEIQKTPNVTGHVPIIQQSTYYCSFVNNFRKQSFPMIYKRLAIKLAINWTNAWQIIEHQIYCYLSNTLAHCWPIIGLPNYYYFSDIIDIFPSNDYWTALSVFQKYQWFEFSSLVSHLSNNVDAGNISRKGSKKLHKY